MMIWFIWEVNKLYKMKLQIKNCSQKELYQKMQIKLKVGLGIIE
jgi:hypothetical protein